MGLVRLVHPFPSTLDALLTAAIATAAGGAPWTIVRLAIAMLAIQSGIGAVNDLADAERDRFAKPGKPIPGGLIGRSTARAVAVVSLGVGLLLAASLGQGVLGIAVLGAGAGLVYDLWLKGTPVSWLPYTVGIPLLPLFAWLGASGTLPGPILVAAGLAVPAGAGLALANELPDLERDLAAGLVSATIALGRGRAWAVGACLQAVVAIAAMLSFQAMGGRAELWPALAGCLALLGVGVGLGASSSVARRQRAWEIQAIALGLLAAVWLGAVGP